MNRYDFDTPIDRHASDSIKWRKYRNRDVIPLWIADMDFPSPPEVSAALHRRVDHGIYGYGTPSDDLIQTIIVHLQRAYDWAIEADWIVWLPGLVTGLNVACRGVGEPGNVVATAVPVYPPFLTAPKFSRRLLYESRMIVEGNRWQLDFDDLEKNLPAESAMFILCNPQNPTGRIFDREELERLVRLCTARDIVICSDEIHCDLLIEPSRRHVPLATLSPETANRTITLMAPSKTYNIPGLGCSFAVISNDALRRRFCRAMAGIVPDVNVLGLIAAQAAIGHGGPWLSELIAYLRTNRDMVYQEIKNMPGLSMILGEATYLAWIDARALHLDSPQQFFEQHGVGLSDGADFGAPGFLRLNFGCRRELLHQALQRMSEAIGSLR